MRFQKCAPPAHDTKNPVGQMTLTFPNSTRSYDTKRRGVHFQGYDGMFEVPFFVTGDALSDERSQADAEAQYLAAFNSSRNTIYDVAREIYCNGRKGIYVLTAADFR